METYEGWVTTFIENLKAYFDFQTWRIEVQFSDTQEDDCYASTAPNSTYYLATIKLYKQSRLDFEEGSKNSMDRLTMSLVHELIHLFLDPFHEKMVPFLSEVTTEDFTRVMEQQTQKLTMVFLKSLPPDLIPPR